MSGRSTRGRCRRGASEESLLPATVAGLRLGLCCQFADQPIKFRTTTAAALAPWPRREQLRRLADVGAANACSLLAALQFCAANGIRSFRIGSTILPVKTHPSVGYRIAELPGAEQIVAQYRRCGDFARTHGIRTGFHPDQFVVLNSPDTGIVARAIADLESQAEIAEWTNADTVNLHGGGGYGDKPSALERLRRGLDRLSARARSRLTVENDDKTFTPADLLPLCRAEGVPLVYDVHHHRCCPDSLTVEAASAAARRTWDREPLFHLSSPLGGWDGPRPERHHDYIDPRDFPAIWRGLNLTVEVEAKAKELAVARLQRALDVPSVQRRSTGASST
jgi:UV DNA damage endonuclease